MLTLSILWRLLAGIPLALIGAGQQRQGSECKVPLNHWRELRHMRHYHSPFSEYYMNIQHVWCSLKPRCGLVW